MLRTKSLWLATITLLTLQTAATAVTVPMTLQTGSFIDLSVRVTDTPFPGVFTSTVGRTDMTGAMSLDLTGTGLSITGAQFMSGAMAGTTTSVSLTFPAPIGVLGSTLTGATYGISGPVEVVGGGQFQVGNSTGVINGGSLSFPLGVPPYDFAATPRDLDLTPGMATLTGNLTPGGTVTLSMPVQFTGLQVMYVQNGAPGNGFIDGTGTLVATGVVPVPEPGTIGLALFGLGAILVSRLRRRTSPVIR